jgi:hypothetical protein
MMLLTKMILWTGVDIEIQSIGVSFIRG